MLLMNLEYIGVRESRAGMRGPATGASVHLKPVGQPVPPLAARARAVGMTSFSIHHLPPANQLLPIIASFNAPMAWPTSDTWLNIFDLNSSP